MPEWYLVIAGLLALSLLGMLWPPLLLALPLLALAAGAPIAYALLSAAYATFPTPSRSAADDWRRRSLTALLYLAQPLARLLGRLRLGLTPWRRRGAVRLAFPRPRTCLSWSEQWQSAFQRLESSEAALREQGAVVVRGGDFDRWDLEVRGGLFGGVRLRLVVEEHGGGKQLVRLASRPIMSPLALLPVLVLTVLSAVAAADQAWLAMEFGRVEALPARTAAAFELAVGGADPPREHWRRLGWSVVDSEAVSRTPDDYRSYIQSSRGEFSVAKNVYVATKSGWFSCRSVCYLAAGRPVVVQDTGFSDFIPTGEGLFAFSTLEEAERAIAAVEADYGRHQRAAQALAREAFAADRVLGRLLAEVGL